MISMLCQYLRKGRFVLALYGLCLCAPALAGNVRIAAGSTSAPVTQLTARLPATGDLWTVWSPSGHIVAAGLTNRPVKGWLVESKLAGQGGPPRFVNEVIQVPVTAPPGRGYKCAWGILAMSLGKGFTFDVVKANGAKPHN